MLRYTLMRLGIFVGCFVVVWGGVYAGVLPSAVGDSNGIWVILLALVVSAPISFVVLRGERDRASERIVERMERAKVNLELNRAQED
jgi:drug/metabolite transporter (DMT)-like permease